MPKKRTKNSREIEKRIFILCEGKSEYLYLNAFKNEHNPIQNRILVQIRDVEENTGYELAKKVGELREKEGLPKDDIAWIVYDKDGYTEHAKTFNYADTHNINIAFSAISFEIWILLHFAYSTKSYAKSEEIIKVLKNSFNHDYSKTDPNIYRKTKDKLQTAIENSKKLRNHHKASSQSNTKIYNHNPYTNLDELITQIQNCCK